MNKIEAQLAKFKSLDIWDVTRNVLNTRKEEVIDLVTGQLQRGETKTGRTAEHTMTPMSESYVEMKRSLGRIDPSILPHMNLYNEGDFYDGMTVVIKKELVEIFSQDSKASKLEKEFTSDIYELNEDSMIELKLLILPDILTQIRKQLGY